jgi:DNA mismatch endonuclease (patch repair protein)
MRDLVKYPKKRWRMTSTNERESVESRSATMRAVRSMNTAPEVIVRKLLHGLGYRYRLHVRNLPGTPDIVFRPRKKAVFINGCFWHGHDCVRGARVPKSNTEYWLKKIARNRARDKATRERLREDGWRVLVLWECELSDEGRLVRALTRFLRRAPRGR